MKNKTKIILVLLAVGILFLLTYFLLNTKREYTKNLYYMDTYIYVKIYEKANDAANKALTEIENIYREYHELTDRYNHYDGVINIYDIYHNNLDSDTLTLDSKLYDILVFADSWNKVHDKLNIEIGSIIDIWKKYRDLENGIPTKEELEEKKIITNLVLLGDNQILNNHPNLDLGSIAKGYATEQAGNYLESIGIKEYLINAGGNVKVGNSYQKENYKIGIQSPVESDELMTIINGKNISVISSGGYERNYQYNGKIYHHIIDPETLFPANYVKGVTVITQNSAIGDALSTILFLMSVDEGQELIKNYDAEAIWYTNDNIIIRSENFNQYE